MIVVIAAVAVFIGMRWLPVIRTCTVEAHVHAASLGLCCTATGSRKMNYVCWP